MRLRLCKHCSKAAYSEEELDEFVKCSRSKHGRRNMCTSCETRRVNGDKKNKVLSCTQCSSTFNILDANSHFRRTKATGDKVVGELSRICKKCELENANKRGEEFIEIQGRLVPIDIKEQTRNSRITNVTVGAI